MDNSVIIKGLNNGIIVVLDAGLDFEILKEKVTKKFKDSSKFLGNAKEVQTNKTFGRNLLCRSSGHEKG